MRNAHFQTLYVLIIYSVISYCEENSGDSFSFSTDNISHGHTEGGHSKKNHQAEISNIALKAAEDAKAAEEAQQPAAQQAARHVKEQLAEKAIQAAKAAEASLVEKQDLVNELQSELAEAEVEVNEETAGIQLFQQAVQSANKVVQEAQAEEKLIETSLQLARNDIKNSQQALEGAQRLIVEKEQTIDSAKTRADSLNIVMCGAKKELAKIKESARTADKAAANAKQNAGRTKRLVTKKDFRKK